MANFLAVQLQLKNDTGRTQVFDPVRRKWYVLTPEEHVRQHVLSYLIEVLKYPKNLIAVERKLIIGGMAKRYDIVVYNRTHIPWMLVECKAPDVPISQATLQQLLTYYSKVQCDYWLLTNGHETYCADARNRGNIKWIEDLPAYDV